MSSLALEMSSLAKTEKAGAHAAERAGSEQPATGIAWTREGRDGAAAQQHGIEQPCLD